MVRVLFVIRCLDAGGTERQLVELLRGLDPVRVRATVLTFYPGGELEAEVRALEHVRLVSIGKRGRWDLVGWMPALGRILNEVSPDVVHGYLGFPNLIALAAGRLRGAAVVWGLRSSFMDLTRYDWLARLEFRLGRLLSPLADAIIVNSHRGREFFASRGFAAGRMVTIHNGIDTSMFRPDPDGRIRLRREWQIGEECRLVGLVGRLDPMKDHVTFLEAAAQVARVRQDLRFVCVGGGAPDYLRRLVSAASDLGVRDLVRFVPGRQDLPAVYSAFDVAVLSSYGEGFPNVVAEAMACGVPCVVTEVGDAPLIVGTLGVVVPPRDPERLAAGVLRSLEAPVGSSEDRRRRVVELFSRARLAARTMAELERVAGRRA